MEAAGIVTSHSAPVNPAATDHAPVIVVTTRAHHLDAVWRATIAHLPRILDRHIIVCCNGLVEEIMDSWQRRRPDIHFHAGMVTAGITGAGPGRFIRSDTTGKCYFGPLAGHAGPHASPLPGLTKLFPAQVLVFEPSIVERTRKKWVFNTAANTLAGVLRLPRNDLMISAHRKMFRELFDEAYDLACELWAPWRKEDQRNPGHREVLWLELCQLIVDTGANENSMSRAARLGKGTGEARFLGGVAFGHEGYPELKRMTRLLLDQARD